MKQLTGAFRGNGSLWRKSFKYLLWNVTLLILEILQFSVTESISHCLSTEWFFLHFFWRATVIGKGCSGVLPTLWSSLVRSSSHQSQPAQSSQDYPVLYPGEIQNFSHIISYVCKASRLKWGRLRIAYSRKCLLASLARKAFSPNKKIRVPLSINSKLSSKFQIVRIAMLLSKPTVIGSFVLFFHFQFYVSFRN